MWYVLLRIIICLILFIIVLLLFRKYGMIKKKSVLIVTILLFIVVTTLTYFAPVENLFINFSTPQEAFKYSTIGTLEEVITGENSAMVIYSDGGNNSSLQFIPKGDNGWKVGTSLSHTQIATAANKDYYITIDKVNDTNDFYIVIHESFANERKEVTDNKNSLFDYRVEENKGTDTYHYIYYAYVKNINNNYKVMIQGKEIPIIIS